MHIKIPTYAKHRKCSPEYIRRLIKKGKIPESALKRKGKRWLVDPEKSDAALNGTLSHMNRKNRTSDSKSKPSKTKIKPLAEIEKRDMTLAECQKLHERYKAALKQLEYDQKSGKLIPADEVKAAAFECARMIRDQLMNIPNRMGPILANETDPRRVTELLNDEFQTALQQLSNES